MPDEPDLSAIRAIVFDTNAFKTASFDANFLRGWVRNAIEAGVEIWMPEPVLWELASHVADVIGELTTRHDELGARIRRGGFELHNFPVFGSREDIVDRIVQSTRAIGPPVRIIEIDTVASRAIFDQLVTIPPANVEGGVRTGAADSAWIRAVHEFSGNDSAAYVIVSNDAHVSEAFMHWAIDPPKIFPYAKALDLALFPTRPADEETWRALAREVAHLIDRGDWPDADAISGFADADDLLETVFPPYEATAAGGQWVDQGIHGLRVHALLGVGDVVRDRQRPLVHATAFTWAEFEVSARVASPSRTGPLRREIRRTSIRIPVGAEIAPNGDTTNLRVEGEAALLEREARWEDETNAYQDCLMVLVGLVPDLGGFDIDAFIFEGSEFKTYTSTRIGLHNQRPLELEASLDLGEEWEIIARIDDEEVSVRCEYDHTVWVGGAGGGNMEPPWTVSATGDALVGGDAYFALAEFVLRKSLEPPLPTHTRGE